MRQKKGRCQLLLIVLLLLASTPNMAKEKNDEKSKAREWVNARQWANGFKATPHATTNCVEFMNQYQKNKEVWDKTFQWLATHDLSNMKEGKYKVEGTDTYINVQDAMTQDAEKRKIEAHKKTIDLQYVVKGKERFGLTSSRYSKAITAYKPDVTFYESTHMDYVISDKRHFFIFFPCNYHQALLKTGKKSKPIRVVVAKIEYID